MSIEQEIKKQYSKTFTKSDWPTFKLMADFYFKSAAKIRKSDILIQEPYKLMARNIKKRLFLGLAVELLLKSLFLKNDYCINRVKRNVEFQLNRPKKFYEIKNSDFLNPDNTFKLNVLINNLSEVITLDKYEKVLKGLRIAKVFRNKEGHSVVLWHESNRENYTDIEFSIISIYKIGFNEDLDFKISFLKNEHSKFLIK